MEPFKNLINEKIASQMAQAIARSYGTFDQKNFLKNIKCDLEPLELKARVIFIAIKLKKYLPADQKKALEILEKAIKQSEKDTIGLSGFSVWPFTEYIARFGIEDFDLSMNVLKEMTKVFTAEFAVRSFFLFDEKRTLKHFKLWVKDENEHVRRLVSEGSRPLLPWGQKIPNFVKDPKITWELLEILKKDSAVYVRKSVANHLNDHSKNHPDLVVEKLLEWKKSDNASAELDWVIRHATRTLIKKGHAKAFLLHGVEAGKIAVLSQKVLTKKVKLGEALEVEIFIANLGKKSQKIILDSEISLLKANGSHNVKCFKGKSLTLAPKEEQRVTLRIPLRPVTTRTYYSGKQYWNSKVNGISQEKLAFVLTV
jgi:3-methyladenine DNA glycosylase AlkC